MKIDMTIALGTIIHLTVLVAAVSFLCHRLMDMLRRVEAKQDKILAALGEMESQSDAK